MAAVSLFSPKPAPYPLVLRLVDDDETVMFDADPIPLSFGGGGLAASIARTVANRRIRWLDGWVVEPGGKRTRSSIDVNAIAWIDDRRDLMPEGSP
jgi:hypothetical protein